MKISAQPPNNAKEECGAGVVRRGKELEIYSLDHNFWDLRYFHLYFQSGFISGSGFPINIKTVLISGGFIF